MKALKLLMVVTVGVGVGGVGVPPCRHSRRTGRPAARVVTLTPQDYIDIQQLVSSYPYGLDGNTDNGESYASLFAPGAVFGRPRTEGHDDLAALANTQPHGAQLHPSLHHQSRDRAVARRRDWQGVRGHHRYRRRTESPAASRSAAGTTTST